MIELGLLDGVQRSTWAVVSTRARWADEWVVNSQLHAQQASWECSPGMSTAQLYYRYGRAIPNGQHLFQTLAPLSLLRQYVQIEVYQMTELGPETIRKWYGTIEAVGDNINGFSAVNGSPVKQGVQILQCYGLEYLLYREQVLDSVFNDVVSAAFPATSARVRSGRGLAFNAGLASAGRLTPNRTEEKQDGLSYTFEGDETADPQTWSSRDIFEYLCTHHLPLDGAGAVKIAFEFNSGHLLRLPTTDAPVIETHGRSLAELLNELLNPYRMASWRLAVQGDIVTIEPVRLNAAAIPIPSTAGTIPASDQQLALAVQEDPTATARIQRFSTDQADQVVVQGARRTSAVTLAKADATIEEGWEAAAETKYEEGASMAGDYPPPEEVGARQDYDTTVRGRDDLRDVYARFQRPANWIQLVGDGLGGGDPIPAFPIDAAPTDPFPQYLPELQLAPRLPLLDGQWYGTSFGINGNILITGKPPFAYLPPICICPTPQDASKYALLEKLGAADVDPTAADKSRHWSASVGIDDDGRSIRVHMHGERHLIAKDHFSGQPHDSPAQVDFDDFIFTAAFEEDRFCEGRYPDNGSIPTTVDTVRRFVIRAGDRYRRDLLRTDTVVGAGLLGDLRRSNGGPIRDDGPYLYDLARLAYEWYNAEKATLYLTTKQDSSDIQLGVLITAFVWGGAVAAETINSVITAIAIEWPITEAAAGGTLSPPDAATLTLQTQFGQFDPLRL